MCIAIPVKLCSYSNTVHSQQSVPWSVLSFLQKAGEKLTKGTDSLVTASSWYVMLCNINPLAYIAS